ncbi:mycofactocin-coupled SDR family oxidoreductase [Dermatobacter hominis]|uniref:mycofactocin-coupled SDR family oxidoreductase n=1 Tax=Dermatobacter hominis TaxID=2884263 RepID=UPI001D108B63|nr:mycofactocin-coupled SDR family oxidoreductase [Dermatobacter hominis]UDY34627.1 mycofactocin-coupled SDR family oxidoreductase [Dermatobacter hominis]
MTSTSTDRNRRFEGKVVFVTGVARGQGRNHAIRFAQEGARIIGVDLCHDVEHAPYPLATPEDLAETVRRVESAGGAMHAEQADVRDLPALKAAVRAGIERFGRLDVILANAGTYAPLPVQFVSDEAWNETVDINLTGVFHAVKAGVRQLVEQNEGGAIVMTSSTAGIKGMYGSPAYSAAKHGVVGFMRSLALELAPNQIRVNSVHPTSVYTPMIINDVFPKLVAPEHPDPGEDEAAAFLKDMQPMGNPWVEVDDVSNAILFLCSDEARYITGTTLAVDAGALTK